VGGLHLSSSERGKTYLMNFFKGKTDLIAKDPYIIKVYSTIIEYNEGEKILRLRALKFLT
jgi:hypothetical protein